MATYKKGINGPFSGKVGSVIGYVRNGKACMRALPQHNYHYAKGGEEYTQWNVTKYRFITAYRLCCKAKQFINIGYHGVQGMTALNAATRQLMKEALTPEGEVIWENWKPAKGPLPACTCLWRKEGHFVKATWDPSLHNEGWHPTDEALLLVVSKTRHEAVAQCCTATRATGCISAIVPQSWPHEDLAVYLAFKNASHCSNAALAKPEI